MKKFYPEAKLFLQKRNGGAYIGGPPRGVLHTTETADWAGQRSYHIAVKLEDGVAMWRQYMPFDMAARGLRHPRGTVDTNRMGDVCIQVAIVGYADDAPSFPKPLLDGLRKFMRWAETTYGIKPHAPTFQGSESYGLGGVGRMSVAEWKRFDGWCGHQDVPSQTHWGPGKIDIEYLLGKGEIVVSRDKFVEGWQRQLNDHGFPAGKPDGVPGPNTEKGVRGLLSAVVKSEHRLDVLERRLAKLREV